MPIAKITKGPDPRRVLQYVLTKTGATFLKSNCESRSVGGLTQEFDVAHQRHRRNGAKKQAKKVVHHCSLGFPLDSHLPPETKLAIAQEYIEGMGFKGNQYVIAEHHDAQHEHLHLVINRIRLDGTLVPEWQDWKQAESLMREIEQKYNLAPVQPSQNSQIKAPTVAEVRKSREHGTPITRVEIQQALEAVAPTIQTLEQLQEALLPYGIELRISQPLKPQQKKRSSLSPETISVPSSSEDSPPPSFSLLFHQDGITFSASQLGKRYTWKGLQTHFGLTGLSDAPDLLKVGENGFITVNREETAEIAASVPTSPSIENGHPNEASQIEGDLEKTELNPFGTSSEQAYYKTVLKHIQAEISQKELLRPSYKGDLQVALYALHRYPPQMVLKILSQSQTTQAIAHKKGMNEVQQYLSQLLKAARQKQLMQLRQPDQER